MFAQRRILIAAISAWLGVLGLTDASYAASAFSPSREAGCPAQQSGCRSSLLPRPGLQPDYQFYYDTPGYFPGFLPAAGMASELNPPARSGFSEGPFGIH